MCRRIMRLGLIGLFGCLVVSILIAILPPQHPSAPAQVAATSAPTQVFRTRLPETAAAAPLQNTQPAQVALVSTPIPLAFATNTLADAPIPTTAEGGTQAWYHDLETEFADQTPLPTTIPASTTPIPARATSRPAAIQIMPTATPAAVAISKVVYVQGIANVRDCPQRTCTLLGTLTGGQSVTADATVQGDAVTQGDLTWYRISYAGREGYVYGELVGANPPAATQAPQQATAYVAQSPAAGQPIPHNCMTAVAMGLSPQQAAQDGLDADHDGVACYGS